MYYLGKVRVFKEEQPLKAKLPMVPTDLTMMITTTSYRYYY